MKYIICYFIFVINALSANPHFNIYIPSSNNYNPILQHQTQRHLQQREAFIAQQQFYEQQQRLIAYKQVYENLSIQAPQETQLLANNNFCTNKFSETPSSSVIAQKNSAEPDIIKTFENQSTTLEQVADEYQELYDIYQEHHLASNHIEHRLHAVEDIQHHETQYITQQYKLSSSVSNLLQEYKIDQTTYVTCFGNQLQQVIHCECITILERTTSIPVDSFLYGYRGELVGFTDTANIYNHYGNTSKAMKLADLCWALFDGAQAAVEGATAGVLAVAQHAIEHPIQTVLYVAIPQYMVAYQLGRVLYDVAKIAWTTHHNPEQGSKQWQNYIAPLTNIVDVLESKQLTIRDKIKLGTQIGMQFYAQHRLLGNLSSFYGKIKNNALEFIQKNPLVAPAEYMATAEGHILGSCNKASQLEKFLEDISHTDCPASCVNNIEKLKYALKIEEFTSIIKVTKHGVQRLIERGFTPKKLMM